MHFLLVYKYISDFTGMLELLLLMSFSKRANAMIFYSHKIDATIVIANI